jgi:hypothetical protein
MQSFPVDQFIRELPLGLAKTTTNEENLADPLYKSDIALMSIMNVTLKNSKPKKFMTN